MANDNDRSTLFTTRSTENAMTFFTVVGFLTLVGVFAICLYHTFHEKKKWDTALVAVWENVPHVLSFATMLTIFKEGVDVMLTRWQEYRDRRKNIIEKAREEGYKKGYEAAKAENRESGSGKGAPHSASEKKKK